MKKAFIFDMDGVLIDSEKAWAKYENDFLERLLGKEISEKVGDTIGVSVEVIYRKAKEAGFTMNRQDFQAVYDKVAFSVYDRAEITPGIEDLAQFLLANNFQLGIVSSSATSWINKVLPRLSFRDKLKILSLNERLDLEHKPYPDGYNEMMRELGVVPETTIILEDSNFGIQAAKASGAFTIALSQNLVAGYKQKGADVYAVTPYDVIRLIKEYKMNLLI